MADATRCDTSPNVKRMLSGWIVVGTKISIPAVSPSITGDQNRPAPLTPSLTSKARMSVEVNGPNTRSSGPRLKKRISAPSGRVWNASDTRRAAAPGEVMLNAVTGPPPIDVHRKRAAATCCASASGIARGKPICCGAPFGAGVIWRCSARRGSTTRLTISDLEVGAFRAPGVWASGANFGLGGTPHS